MRDLAISVNMELLGMRDFMLPDWNAIEIAGKRADVFTPPDGMNSRHVLLYLHPVGEESLSRNARFTAALAERGLACCVPYGRRCWWADRICPEFDTERSAEKHLLEFVVPWMRERWPATGIGLFGISMGGQAAIRLGLKHPKLFPVVAGIASAFDYHEWYGRGTPIDEMYRSKEACRQDTAILQIDSRQFPQIWFACDPDDVDWYRGNDRFGEKLTALGIPHTADLTTRGGGHAWSFFEAMAGPCLDFLVQRLNAEKRSLL